MEEKFYEMTKDLPQLILAMDTNDGNGQYVLIQNAKEDETYYCPCCGGEVKPRAYKKDKEYQVQPHFYHINGGCTEESYIHYVCKMLLTKKNCKFKVGDKEYSVKSVDVEKTYDTKFGKYRPDVTIVTKEDKVFFAEIAHTSQKTQEYLPKWDELGNDVIEIKSNEFINVIVENKIPSFKLIYSNGQCFVKSSLHEDYTKFIYKRKVDWKRQDLLNYKIQWERLDWFFIKLQEYKLGKTSYENMLNSFKQVDRIDKPLLFDLIKKQSCLKGEKQQFRDIINNEMDKYLQEKVEEYKNKGIIIKGKLEPKTLSNSFCVKYKGYEEWFYHGTRKWVNDTEIISSLFSKVDCVTKNIEKRIERKYYKDINENITNKFINEFITPIIELVKNEFNKIGCYSSNKYSEYKSINIEEELLRYKTYNIQYYSYIDSNEYKIDDKIFIVLNKEFPISIEKNNIEEIVQYIYEYNGFITDKIKNERIEEIKKIEIEKKIVNDSLEDITKYIIDFNNSLINTIWKIEIDNDKSYIIFEIGIDTNYDYSSFSSYFNKRDIFYKENFLYKDYESIKKKIKNKLLEAMIEIKDNFNKLDGTNYHYRRFIVVKEEI